MYYSNFQIDFVSAYSNFWRFVSFNYQQYNRLKAELEALKPVLVAVAGFLQETVEGAFECFLEALTTLSELTETETIPEFVERTVMYAESVDLEADEVTSFDESLISLIFYTTVADTFCQPSEIETKINEALGMAWNQLRKFLSTLNIKGKSKDDLIAKYEQYLIQTA